MAEIVRPIPRVTPELAPFFEAARRGQLVVQKCESCGTLRFPPHPLCSRCLSAEASWKPVSGRGEVYSFNVMQMTSVGNISHQQISRHQPRISKIGHQVYHPAFAPEIPYAVVLIKLQEGAKMLANLVGIKPSEIKCGMPVEVVFERLSDEVTLPKFRPVR
jgi:uncharacterized OB-fold protein